MAEIKNSKLCTATKICQVTQKTGIFATWLDKVNELDLDKRAMALAAERSKRNVADPSPKSWSSL